MKNDSAFNAAPKQVGVWIRVSTADQAAGDSPKHHEARARHYAAAKGWIIREVYDLAGVSGKSVVEHPEAKRMLEDVRRGNISALIFSKLARLTRNARELMDFSDFFRQHNADLISLQENIDTGTPSGRLFYNMVAVMAQWEREEIADRVNSSIAIRAKLGKPINGKVAYGYYWNDKKLRPHPDEAPVRKLIYELFAEHKRKKTVARILNERGYRTRDGSKFSDTTVGRLIQDTTAKGIHRANFTRRVAADKPYAFKPEHEWVFNAVEPIVTPELWLQCNSLLEARRTQSARPAKRAVQLFAGLATCSCGKKMYVPTNTPKYVCMACRNKIPIVDLEGIFLDELKNYLVSPEHVAGYLKGASDTIAEKTRLLETLRKEQHRVNQEVEHTFKLYYDGVLNAAQFKGVFQPLDIRKNQIHEELPRLEAEVDLLKIDGLSSEHIVEEIKTLHSRWPSLTREDRRRIVELLVKDIVIGNGEITLNLCYLPSFEEMTNRQRIV
jgi:site-specific DNA recombinase